MAYRTISLSLFSCAYPLAATDPVNLSTSSLWSAFTFLFSFFLLSHKNGTQTRLQIGQLVYPQKLKESVAFTVLGCLFY